MMRSPVGEDQTQAVLGPIEQQGDWRSQLYFPLRGNVVAVYGLDDEKNEAHVQFCDVQLHDGYPMVHRVSLGRAGFHQETKEPGPPGHRWRNGYEPWKENGTNGWSQSVLPGDLVLVQFVGGRWTEPYISGFWPASNQGRENDDHPHGGGYPFNQQSRFRVTGGELVEEITKRLDATPDQMPQWTWSFNGAFIEILNDGSILMQSSVNQGPLIPKDKPKIGLKKSPDPVGNFVLSTRGAKHGDIALTTGQSDGTGNTNAGGNVLVLGYRAKEGNVVINLALNDEGNIVAQGSTENPSQIFLRAQNEDDYLNIYDKESELSGAENVTLRSRLVYLGRYKAPKSAVTWEELCDALEQMWALFDVHEHIGVTSGEDNTGPPSEPVSLTWLGLEPTFQSLVVKLELGHQDDNPIQPRIKIYRGVSSEAREIERPQSRTSSYQSQRRADQGGQP